MNPSSAPCRRPGRLLLRVAAVVAAAMGIRGAHAISSSAGRALDANARCGPTARDNEPQPQKRRWTPPRARAPTRRGDPAARRGVSAPRGGGSGAESSPAALHRTAPSRPAAVAGIAASLLAGALSAAGAAAVLSGYFGAWVASRIIGKWHDVLPTLSHGILVGGDDSQHGPLGKYRWTALASAGVLLLHATGLQADTVHSRLSDAAFVAALWAYSRLVDPLLGGVVGCTHVALGLAAATFARLPAAARVLGLAGDLKLKKLGQYAGEDGPYVALAAERTPRAPVAMSTPNRLGEALADALGSASLLLAFPQCCLGLYLLGGTVAAWSRSRDFLGRWDRGAAWLRWLGEGLCRPGATDGAAWECGAAAAGDAVREGLRRGEMTTRLVALYWIVAVAKFVVAYAVL